MTIKEYIHTLRLRRSQLKMDILITAIDGVIIDERDVRYLKIRLITKLLRLAKKES